VTGHRCIPRPLEANVSTTTPTRCGNRSARSHDADRRLGTVHDPADTPSAHPITQSAPEPDP
jgi:hypothetical protein